MLTYAQHEAVLSTKSNNYRKIVSQFCEVVDLSHGAIGLMTELVELENATDDVNKKEELADCLWYNELLKASFGIERYESPDDAPEITLEIARMHGEAILDFAKRCIFYGQHRDDSQKSEERKQRCLVAMSEIERFLSQEAEKLGTTYVGLAELVCKKLAKRYPNKFNNTDALFRNLKDERELLENESTENPDPYNAGPCPECGEPAIGAERRPDGYVHCKNGHKWKRP